MQLLFFKSKYERVNCLTHLCFLSNSMRCLKIRSYAVCNCMYLWCWNRIDPVETTWGLCTCSRYDINIRITLIRKWIVNRSLIDEWCIRKKSNLARLDLWSMSTLPPMIERHQGMVRSMIVLPARAPIPSMSVKWWIRTDVTDNILPEGREQASVGARWRGFGMYGSFINEG